MSTTPAFRFTPEKLVGLDVDSSLIEKANKSLQSKREKKLKREKELDQAKNFPISLQMVFGPIKKEISPYPDNLSFIAVNALEYQPQEKYDCITW